MGVFDEIYFECKDCGERVYFQSKANDGCGHYKWDEAPFACLGDIYHEYEQCSCGNAVSPKDYYNLFTRKDDDDCDA